jgi:nucleoside phosphorylase
MPEPPRAVIFTALPVETAAVTAHLDDLRAVRWERDVHQRGNFSDGVGWDVLVVETGAETRNAALETQAALWNFEPAVAIFVGIAGGFEEKGVAEFDLVVPPVVDYYGAGKAADSFTARPRQDRPTHFMINAIRQVEREGAWLHRLDPKLAEPMTVHLAPLASGDHVVKSLDSETYELIRENYDQAVAVDMESSGFLFAANLRPGIESAVIRGVSDLLSDKNLERDAARQPEAARRAAAFAFELLATTPLDVLSIRDLRVEPTPWKEGVGSTLGTAAAGAEEHPAENDTLGRIAVELGEELATILDLDHWARRTEHIFLSNSPAISVDFDERLAEALAWTEARISVPGLESLMEAIANLGTVLRDLRDVFHHDAEPTLNGRFLRLRQFYRAYDKPVSERDRLTAEYGKLNLLIKDLTAETTRAVNLINDRIRELEPRYRVTRGAAGILAGSDESFIVVTYRGEERELPDPYPGLSGFAAVLSSRDGSFGPYRHREPWPEEVLDQLDAALAADDLAAAHAATFEFAVLVAATMAPRQTILVSGGHGGRHTVQVRRVTVRWRSPDGLRCDDPVLHLARTFITPRGMPDTSKERLVGTPDDGAVGEVLEADSSAVLKSLRDSDLAPFAAEARQILEQLEDPSR